MKSSLNTFKNMWKNVKKKDNYKGEHKPFDYTFLKGKRIKNYIREFPFQRQD